MKLVCNICKKKKQQFSYGLWYNHENPVCIRCYSDNPDVRPKKIYRFTPIQEPLVFIESQSSYIEEEKTEATIKIYTEMIVLKEELKKTKKERKNKKRSYPITFTKKARLLLNEARGNNGCTACGTKELLQVHHIDHNKFNNEDSNLLVLCFYCHAKEHKHMQGRRPAKFFK